LLSVRFFSATPRLPPALTKQTVVVPAWWTTVTSNRREVHDVGAFCFGASVMVVFEPWVTTFCTSWAGRRA